jgi:hypothetical protein
LINWQIKFEIFKKLKNFEIKILKKTTVHFFMLYQGTNFKNIHFLKNKKYTMIKKIQICTLTTTSIDGQALCRHSRRPQGVVCPVDIFYGPFSFVKMILQKMTTTNKFAPLPY